MARFFISLVTVVVVLTVRQCYSADPVLTPNTLTDSKGNTADSGSNITWGQLPQGQTYSTDATYDSGGMGALFDFARSFINTALPGGFPSEIIFGIFDGSFNIAVQYMEILQSFAGYAACIVIGILFIIIFTLVGCCFCCCRCCGNCGGKMIQNRTPSTSCRRKVYSVVMFVLVVFTTTGMICVFVSNERISTSISKYGTTMGTNLDDLNSYLDNTVTQVKHLLGNDLNFTFDVVDRDLNNIDVLVGIPLRDSLNTLINADALFNSIAGLQTDVSRTVGEFDTVNNDLTNFKSNFTTFNNSLSAWITNYENTKASCAAPCSSLPNGNDLKSNIDVNQIDISSSETEINKIRNQDMGQLVQDARNEFNSIPERVKNESKGAIDTISSEINSYKGEVEPIVDSVNDIEESFSGTVDTNSIKADVGTYTEEGEKYDKYRWYGGIGLACIILLVVILQVLGLVFGVCGSSADTLPTERSCLSNSGGNMMMASVGFIFIFSWLLMLLTMLCFLIGAPMERYFCQELSDPELTTITELLDKTGIMPSGNGSYLGQVLLSDSSVDLTIPNVLKDCKEDKTIWTALKLNRMSAFNLTVVTDYKNSIDIDSQISAINIDFSSIDIAPASLTSNMNDFKNSITSLDFATYTAELNKDATGSDLNAFISQMQNVSSGMSNGTHKIELDNRIAELRSISNVEYANVITAKNTLASSMNVLQSSVSSIPTTIDNLLSSLNTSETSLQTNGPNTLTNVLTSFVNRIFRIVDALIARAIGGLENDVAKCKPIYNVYQSLVVVGLCKYLLDAFNGFWFSLGWCIFFFVPSTIFAVKLAKHFRTMSLLDGYDSTLPSKNNDPVIRGSPPPAYNFGDGNKVGHSDKF